MKLNVKNKAQRISQTFLQNWYDLDEKGVKSSKVNRELQAEIEQTRNSNTN